MWTQTQQKRRHRLFETACYVALLCSNLEPILAGKEFDLSNFVRVENTCFYETIEVFGLVEGFKEYRTDIHLLQPDSFTKSVTLESQGGVELT